MTPPRTKLDAVTFEGTTEELLQMMTDAVTGKRPAHNPEEEG